MQVWNGIGRYPAGHGTVVASIGNYDGVHLGHQEILRHVVRDAAARGRPSLLITFDPHPLAVVAPERRPRLLQTREQKLFSLEQTGLTDLLLLEFTHDVAALSGDEFFTRLLHPTVTFGAIHVGENFRFGRGRGGDDELLRSIGGRAGFDVHRVDPVRVAGKVVSSSAIRTAVLEGDVEGARGMLGRPFAAAGEVIRGEGRGRRMHFPTANVHVDNETLPKTGVYITETVAVACRHPSITNVGFRPTFGGGSLVVESHLLDFDGELYGERVEVRFLARIRDELTFSTASELGDQIARDRAAAQSYFQNVILNHG